MNSIREILYADKEKLISYLQCVCPDTIVKPVKHSKFSFSISPVPKVGGDEVVRFRDITIHELVEEFESHLCKDNRLIYLNDVTICPSDRRGQYIYREIACKSGPQFIKYRFTASRAVIPQKARSVIEGLRHIALWIATKSECIDSNLRIYLLESSHSDNDYGYCHVSSYSALHGIINELLRSEYDFKATLLGIDGNSERCNYRDHEPFEQFAYNPTGYLEKMGCLIGPPRNIECIFRVRLVFRETNSGDRSPCVIGYPLYIEESGLDVVSTRQTPCLQKKD